MLNLPALDKGSSLTYLGKQKKRGEKIETKTIMRAILLGQFLKWLFNQWLCHIITVTIRKWTSFHWYSMTRNSSEKRRRQALPSHRESKGVRKETEMLNLCLLPGKQKKSGRKPRKRLLQYDNAEILNKQSSQVTTTHTAPQLLGTDDRIEHISHFSF